MASDLIYREDAKVFVRHACYKKINPIDYLDEVPAADVRPVKNGRWIELENQNYSPFDPTSREYDLLCSNCGAKHYGKERNFCPNCGADMRI